MCKLPPHRATHTPCLQTTLPVGNGNTPCSMLPGNGPCCPWHVWREMGGHLSEPSKGGERAQSCRSSAKGARAGAVGSRDTAEGPLTHLAAAWKEVGAAIWREDLVCRLSNMEGANLRRRLAEQGSICTRQEGSAGTTLCSPLPDPAVPRSLSHPAHISAPSTPLLPPQLGPGCFSLQTKIHQVNSDQQFKLQMPPQWIFT